VSGDTGQFRALTAGAGLRRGQSRRPAPGRHRVTERKPEQRQPWQPADRYWWGGYATAMQEILELATDVAEATDCPMQTLSAVLQLTRGAIELQQTDSPPVHWPGPAAA
jgi:hypothetical protein